MNRILNFTAIAVLLATFLVSGEVAAATATIGGYTWTYQINGNTAEIYKGTHYAAAISPSPTGSVTIPSTLGGKPVVSIGHSAFYNCAGLTSVTIPNSVTSIAVEAKWPRNPK